MKHLELMMKAFLQWAVRNRVHFMSWLAFILWETLFIGLSFGEFGHPMTYVLHYLLIIGLFYFNSLHVLPWVFKKSAQFLWRLPLALIFEISFFILGSYLVDLLLKKIGAFSSAVSVNLTGVYVIRTLYRCVQFLGFSTGYYYLVTLIDARKKYDMVERQRLQEIIQKQIAQKEAIRAQNAYLTAQINPHFFFNTLDYFYHNARKISPDLAEGISSLANIMRFAIHADKIGGFIRLGEELEQVQALIYLHSVRQKQFINLDYDEELEDILFIPLIILTLTENVFKHGIMHEESAPAIIKVYADSANLIIETSNKINYGVTRPTSSTGLKNIEHRLKANYGNQFQFDYSVGSESYFKTKLVIKFEALNDLEAFSYPSADTDTTTPHASAADQEKAG
ncbi:hypothetical protein FPZ42_07180 [Mucilaginibacter achroorhodeus]|uniref:Signal transduction histidine kinase internal region domain-containing protein n=1 Tax=Mucilaginibacter achroorhodeus TaxID=2599294 RepID=A0A563U657_9SPHI|nr:histidine kinase [Mucilaginibacter achroorhodeus]TWR26813.1 hypothetical protein FPZ42_07180 [Mucilaginibacter achroorhodeus]